jgi:arginine utilization regulatory protein
VRRLGSLRETEIDVKIISSVNQEPRAAISENNLRPDLFYRLGVVLISIPPLRERKEDIVLLARHFLAKHSLALNRKVTDISTNVLDLFNEYDWPGNVRELEHVIEGAINLVVSSRSIAMRHLQCHLTAWQRLQGQPGTIQPSTTSPSLYCLPREQSPNQWPVPLNRHEKAGRNSGVGLQAIQADHEKTVLAEALTARRGHITRAAKDIGISRQLFNYKMRKYRICRQDFLI